MLRKIREKTTGWVAMAILGILIVPFALFGLDQYLVQSGSSTVASIKAPPAWWSSAPSFWPASVFWRHEEVGTEEFRNRFEQVRQQQRAEQGDAFDARAFEAMENKRAVLDSLIDQKIQAMAAQAAGVTVSDAMVINEIQRIPAFQVDGRFDPQRYQLALASQVPARTPAQFDQLVRESLEQGLVMTALAESSFVTDAEMDRLIRLLGELRDVSVLLVPAADAGAEAIGDADVQAWYDAHVADYRAPERVTIEYISLDAADLPPVPPADEATLRQRYEQESDKFAQQEERLASHILVEVSPDADAAAVQAAEAKASALAAQARAAGADFAALAQNNSDDAASAGGDLGWISRGMMPGALEDAVFAMSAGEISDPVRTEFGFHVIQLREVKAGEREPFEAVRDTLAREQETADRESQFNDLSSRVVDAVLQNPSGLALAAEAANVKVQKLGPFDAGSNDGIAASPAVKRAAFSDVLIQDGTVSDPIEVGPDHNVWIRVVSHTPEEAQPLAKVRDQVVASIRAERRETAARERALALQSRLEKGESLAALASAESLAEPEVLTAVPRGAPLVAPGVADAMFALQVKDGGKAVGSKVLDDGRIVLFTVDKVTPGNAAEFPQEQREMLQQQLGQAAGIDDVQALISSLRKSMKIRVLEENL
ncbi:peptidyl-prolyl cis-trans isomerase [Lysobacter ciconiae]|uniref:Periplasmic chaperone PpiD n=1 Tax=Novilysobacter ciconiae TaxID=2781022 RepID=A0A7S6UEV3_9GAMM|nr:peptidyl-prolyl cis-trans isomerase [Lysobacter ciconiae]QOW18971.1 peptidyl-prolyl cis-trans isomerase [Lysobacter ciconiae]